MDPWYAQLGYSQSAFFCEKLGFEKLGETEVDPNLGWSGIEYEGNCTQAR